MNWSPRFYSHIIFKSRNGKISSFTKNSKQKFIWGRQYLLNFFGEIHVLTLQDIDVPRWKKIHYFFNKVMRKSEFKIFFCWKTTTPPTLLQTSVPNVIPRNICFHRNTYVFWNVPPWNDATVSKVPKHQNIGAILHTQAILF